jgi:hypothetical protein
MGLVRKIIAATLLKLNGTSLTSVHTRAKVNILNTLCTVLYGMQLSTQFIFSLLNTLVRVNIKIPSHSYAEKVSIE